MKVPGMEKPRATHPLCAWHQGDKSRRHQKHSCPGQAPNTSARRVLLAWCWLVAARHSLATHLPGAELPWGVKYRGSGMGAPGKSTWSSASRSGPCSEHSPASSNPKSSRSRDQRSAGWARPQKVYRNLRRTWLLKATCSLGGPTSTACDQRSCHRGPSYRAAVFSVGAVCAADRCPPVQEKPG